MSHFLELVWELLDIRRLKTTAYHPQCDGLSERFIQNLKLMMTAFEDSEQLDWDLNLNKLAYAFDSSVHSTTGFTPYEMQFGRKPKIPIDLVIINPNQNLLGRERREVDELNCVN